jgi:type I restriction enzyme S subunit
MNTIIDKIDLWTTAQELKTSNRGLSARNQSLLGIKKLRELILELAVCGKLVSQDPSDEPAAKLLKKYEFEKSSLPITEDEITFKLPMGWEWCRLGDIGVTNIGLTYSPNDISDDGTPVLRSSNVQNGEISLEDLVRVTKNINEKVLVKDGDLLICARNGSRDLVGKCALIKDLTEQTAFGAFMAIFRSDFNDYIKYFIESPIYRRSLEGVSTTTINQITQGNLKNTLLPLPPLAEQYRIVAKVDELMALCDELENQQTNSNVAHETLVATLLGSLTDDENSNSFDESWQRIANHFDILFTTEHSIDQFKQTILQLAVMGKLVPQNPEDEPAAELLKKIAKEKAQLVKEGKIKKQSPLSEISDDEKPFELPKGWEWVRLGTTGFGSTGKTPSTNNSEYFNGEIPFVGPGQITPDGKIVDSDKSLTVEGCEYSTIADLGDILMVCIGGSIGKSAIVKSRIAFNQQLNCIRPLKVSSFYLYMAMNAPYFQTSILSFASGSATPIINRSKWEDLPISLPPLAEQLHIIAKVDELFVLCDGLKERIVKAQTLQNQMAMAVVEQALN